MVIGGAVPVFGAPLTLPTYDPLRSGSFCERRELGIVAVGGAGAVVVDGQTYDMEHHDVLYVGSGARDIAFRAVDADEDAAFYLVAALSHVRHPNRLVRMADAQVNAAGSAEGANRRTIRKYIHAEGAASSQLVLGITVLEPGSVWNTWPCHTHERRMEVYLYFDMAESSRVFHMHGQPNETRHLVMANEQAAISPSWSIHAGVGTGAYTFIWAMAGENQNFDDMDNLAPSDIR